MDRFTSRVNRFVKEREAMRRAMRRRGPALIKRGQRLGLSLTWMARQMGVHISRLSNAKNRSHNPHYTMAPAMYVKLSEAIRREVKERKARQRELESC